MKVNNSKLIVVYLITYLIFAIHFFVTVTDCTAYFMHDAAMKLSIKKLILRTSFLFLPPIVILFIANWLKQKTPTQLYLAHYFISTLSILLLAVAINKPCEKINGGNFMFINFATTSISYLLNFFSLILLLILFFKMVLNIYKTSS